MAKVEEYGWCSLRIPSTFEFAYTVGLWHNFRVPELVMFGLDGEYMQRLLNDCAERIREHGLPEPEVPFSGVLEGFETQLRPVDESWRDAFFGSAYRFYRGQPVPVWQLIWPDANGKWPWLDDATVSSRIRQPFAWLPVDEHPVGSWRLLGHFAGDFPLPAQPDSWALTTRSILDGSADPATVLFADDVFDVLDERGHEAEDLCATFLGDLVLRYPSLRLLGEMTNNSAASVTSDGGWHRSAISDRQSEASVAAWKRAESYQP